MTQYASHVQIPNQQLWDRYEVTATPTKGPWPITFSFFQKADLRVSVNGEELSQSGFSFTADKYIGGYMGGSLMVSSFVSNAVILIWRDIAAERTTDFSPAAIVQVQAIDTAFDQIMAIAQDLKRDGERTFRVAPNKTGAEIGEGDEGLVAVDSEGNLEFLPVASFRGEDGTDGAKGDPGGGGGAIGLFSEIAGLTIPAGTDLVQVTGRAALGDGAAGKSLIRVTDAVILDSDVLDAAAERFRWAPGQIFCPEMFADDAETNALTAFRHMHDLVNYYGGGHCVGQPGADYQFPNVATTPTTFGSRTFTRVDGKTCTHSFIGRGVGEPRDPQLAGVAFYTFDGQGCTLTMDGDFNLTAADYQSGYRKRTTRIVWDMWKCANVLLENFTWEGGWDLQTTDTGASGEDWGYCIRLTGVAGCEVRHVVARNGSQDFIVAAHRNKASLNSIALVSTEAYPEPDQSTADVHDPAGICHSLVVRSCVIDHFRRQGLSPVGMGFRDMDQDFPGLTIEDTIISNIGRYPGTAPRWFPGDPTDGSIKWQWRGFPPRSGVDFEPVRVSGYQVTDNVFRNCNFTDCIGSFSASYGSWRRARVEQSLPYTAVDVTANTFTKTSLTLPRTRLGGIPAKIRCWSDDTLPGGLAERTDYYLSKTSDTVFKLHTTAADAIAGTNAVDITSQGAGNHWFIWYDTPPNVGKITFDGCTLRHPADGSVQPMQVNCELLTVVNCRIHVAAGSAFLGPSAVYDERQVWHNNQISFVRGGFDVDAYVFLKSQALGAAIDTTAETLTLDVDDGLGKYEFVPIKLKVSGTSAAMPGGLTQGVTYWMTRVSTLVRKFSTTVENARNGVYVNLTDQGVATLSWYRDLSQYDVIGNSFEHMPRTLEFDASQVSTVTGRIPIPTLKYLREGVSDSEHFEVTVVTSGAALPTGLAAATTYYAFTDYEDETGVYLAATSADAIAHIPVIPTVVGSGRCRLAPTVTQALIDVLDANCRFTDNTIIVDMTAAVANGTMVRLAGLSGFYGGNHFTTRGGSSLVPTLSYARMTVDKADVLKGGWTSTGP